MGGASVVCAPGDRRRRRGAAGVRRTAAVALVGQAGGRGGRLAQLGAALLTLPCTIEPQVARFAAFGRPDACWLPGGLQFAPALRLPPNCQPRANVAPALYDAPLNTSAAQMDPRLLKALPDAPSACTADLRSRISWGVGTSAYQVRSRGVQCGTSARLVVRSASQAAGTGIDAAAGPGAAVLRRWPLVAPGLGPQPSPKWRPLPPKPNPDRGRVGRGRQGALNMGHVLAHARQDTKRRHGGRRRRPLLQVTSPRDAAVGAQLRWGQGLALLASERCGPLAVSGVFNSSWAWQLVGRPEAPSHLYPHSPRPAHPIPKPQPPNPRTPNPNQPPQVPG